MRGRFKQCIYRNQSHIQGHQLQVEITLTKYLRNFVDEKPTG